jgi:hypothetical protein
VRSCAVWFSGEPHAQNAAKVPDRPVGSFEMKRDVFLKRDRRQMEKV